jgi:hypothetical protein
VEGTQDRFVKSLSEHHYSAWDCLLSVVSRQHHRKFSLVLHKTFPFTKLFVEPGLKIISEIEDVSAERIPPK